MTAWTPGPEIKRLAVEGGAMLYDASRASNFDVRWFNPAHWISNGAAQGEATGRGRTLFFAEGDLRGALRHYRRGGMVARLLGDRYLFTSESATRPFSEFQLTWQLYSRGLPVAAPVAARYVRAGNFYTADLITARVMGSESLAERLTREPLPLSIWVAVGRCIRRFHEVGVCHADLNAHNILLVNGELVYLIDFDRGRLRGPGLWRDSNLVRLRRSFEKVTDVLPSGRFTDTDWQSLLAGYRAAPELVRG